MTKGEKRIAIMDFRAKSGKEYKRVEQGTSLIVTGIKSNTIKFTIPDGTAMSMNRGEFYVATSKE